MGNGPGNIKEYMDAFYKYPTLQGGFAWEWANHGLLTKDKVTGEDFYAYGGDFGEEVHDATFVMDGLVNSDHKPNAGLIEYKKAIEPVQLLEASTTTATFINRYDFITLDHLVAKYTTVSSEPGAKPENGVLDIPRGIAPGQTFDIALPQLSASAGETLLNISFHLATATPFLPADFETATAQVNITPMTPLALPAASDKPLTVTTPSRNTLSIASETSTWTFNTLHGTLTSWLQKDGSETLSAPPAFSVFRAQTDNDAPQDGWDWTDKKLHLARLSTRSVSWSQPQTNGNELHVTVAQRLAPPVLSWSIELSLTYTFSASGTLRIHVAGTPRGANLPRTLPRIGLVLETPPSFDTVSWFGRGPGESYRDSKFSQRVGSYTSSVDALWVSYEVPQESSNRTDTRSLVLHNASGAGAGLAVQFVDIAAREAAARRTFDFQASRFRMADVSAAAHPHELAGKRTESVVLRLDSAHHGLGSGSCGPRTRDEYALLCEAFEFEVLFQGV